MKSISEILQGADFAELRRRGAEAAHARQIEDFERVSQGLAPLPSTQRVPNPRALSDCPQCEGTGTVWMAAGRPVRQRADHPDTKEVAECWTPYLYDLSCRCMMRARMEPIAAEDCGVGGRLAALTLDGVQAWRVDTDVWAAVRRWAEALPASVKDGELQGLLLMGPVGTGKTGLMVGLIHAARQVGVRSRFVREVDIVKEIRATYDGEGSETAVIERFEKVPFLAIDDLGKAYVPPKQYGQDGLQWLSSILYAILDERLNAGRPTVVSTNLDDTALLRRLGDALIDRLDTYWRLDFTGESRR